MTDEHKDLSGDNISNLLPICPQCNDTKNLTVSSAIKLSNQKIYSEAAKKIRSLLHHCIKK